MVNYFQYNFKRQMNREYKKKIINKPYNMNELNLKNIKYSCHSTEATATASVGRDLTTRFAVTIGTVLLSPFPARV